MDSLHATIRDYDERLTNPIGWCSCTLNFFRGCSRVSEACQRCYAIFQGVRLTGMNPASDYQRLVTTERGRPDWTGVVVRAPDHVWLAPFARRQPMLAFTNSMSDPFHESLPDALVLLFLKTLHKASWHSWQVLTKRHERMASILSRLHLAQGCLQLSPEPLPVEQRALLPNVWLGVTVENQLRAAERLPSLLSVRAMVRFVSVEPMLGPVDLTAWLPGIDWVICGGESADPHGRYRPMDLAWARALRDQCASRGVPFFFKQHAGVQPFRLPKELDGEPWRALPKRERLPVPDRAERAALAAWVRTRLGEWPVH